MTSGDIREKFLNFFENRGHKIVPSASIVPEGDPSVLFTTAGMQQFKQYYTNPQGAQMDLGSLNTASIQKCLRTSDIDEVGDESHLTFFEMLGNFSFGGYWKEEAIKCAYEFVTEELGLQVDYVSVFEGDDEIPPDTESERFWREIDPKIGIKKSGRADNFWGPTGDEGPCGPTTEVYVKGIEIWNIVFNEFYKTKTGKFEMLQIKGIDTGMGLERLSLVVQGKVNVFETDLFRPILNKIEEFSSEDGVRAKKIIADHIRASTFLIADGVRPSNVGRGYILRRLVRRAVRFSRELRLKDGSLVALSQLVKGIYDEYYPELADGKDHEIEIVIEGEERKFKHTLGEGLKQLERIVDSQGFVTGRDASNLFLTFGFPREMTEELTKEKGVSFQEPEQFELKFKHHQEISRSGSEQKFKGGLADHDPETIKLHTAHHLLLAALQKLFGKEVKQRGSNITKERLRMDFSFPRKLSDEEIRKIEGAVNNYISENLAVTHKEMEKSEAEALGAEMEFGAKYPEIVSVYLIEDEEGNVVSKEFCGGPHIERTGLLGKFKIIKEEAVAAGVRRIKAILEKN